MEQHFELKVAPVFPDGTFGRPFTVSWKGHDGLDAAVRYQDSEHVFGREVAVFAWRTPPVGIFVGAPEPGSD